MKLSTLSVSPSTSESFTSTGTSIEISSGVVFVSSTATGASPASVYVERAISLCAFVPKSPAEIFAVNSFKILSLEDEFSVTVTGIVTFASFNPGNTAV